MRTHETFVAIGTTRNIRAVMANIDVAVSVAQSLPAHTMRDVLVHALVFADDLDCHVVNPDPKGSGR